jgi:hypothetical protein
MKIYSEKVKSEMDAKVMHPTPSSGAQDPMEMQHHDGMQWDEYSGTLF